MRIIEMHKEPNGHEVPRYAPVVAPVRRVGQPPIAVKQGPTTFRTLMETVRSQERKMVTLGEIQGPGGLALNPEQGMAGFDMGDIPPPSVVERQDEEDLNPVKPPTSLSDVAEMFVDYSKLLYSKSNLNPSEVMPIAVGLSFYEKYGIRIGMEWLFKLLALKQSEKGPHHRVTQIMNIFQHLVGSTKTTEEKKIQL